MSDGRGRVQREIIDGRGHITWTLSPYVLNQLLRKAEVSNPSQIPEAMLRELCHRSSPKQLYKKLQGSETLGETAVIDRDSQGNPVEIRASDVGLDLMMALVPHDEELERLFDPDHFPVNLELRVFDTSPQAPQNLVENLGTSVLSVTVYPSDFS